MRGADTPRQSSKVGAVCANAARTVLCGGRSAMVVPTATRMPLVKPLNAYARIAAHGYRERLATHAALSVPEDWKQNPKCRQCGAELRIDDSPGKPPQAEPSQQR